MMTMMWPRFSRMSTNPHSSVFMVPVLQFKNDGFITIVLLRIISSAIISLWSVYSNTAQCLCRRIKESRYHSVCCGSYTFEKRSFWNHADQCELMDPIQKEGKPSSPRFQILFWIFTFLWLIINIINMVSPRYLTPSFEERRVDGANDDAKSSQIVFDDSSAQHGMTIR